MTRTRGGRLARPLVAAILLLPALARTEQAPDYLFNDEHVHLTNYIQEGPSVHDFLRTMGTKVGRAALFGIPLQQQWSHRVSGDDAPTYYLQTDAPLYYYSFTDAMIAEAYLSLSPADRKRFNPMITGFNPTDMYAADHIKRVLRMYPGVFDGIGEFTIHKEFVSSKVAGEVASLTDPALDRVLDLAAETGLLVLLHNDVDVPFPKEGEPPAYLQQIKDLFRRHRGATIIWAHIGVGRVVRPVAGQLAIVEGIISDPTLRHVYFDISWSEVAKYVVASDESVKRTAQVINAAPDRFLFGTDEVGPTSQGDYLAVYRQYAPLLKKLTPAAREKLLEKNYDVLFGAAHRKVREWEARDAATSSREVAPSR